MASGLKDISTRKQIKEHTKKDCTLAGLSTKKKISELKMYALNFSVRGVAHQKKKVRSYIIPEFWREF